MLIETSCIKYRFYSTRLVCTLEVQKIQHSFLLMETDIFMRTYAVLSSEYLQTHFFKLTR